MSNVLFGMPILIGLEDLAANVALARDLGLRLVELTMNLPQYSPHRLPSDVVRQTAEASDLVFTLHLPEETDLAALQPAVRRGHLDCAVEAVRWASAAGIRLVNLHVPAGVYFTLPTERIWVYDRHLPTFIENLEASFNTLMAVADECGITVCLENAGHFHLPFMQQAIERLLNRFPALRLTWDIGHDAATGSRERPLFEGHRQRIGHMHLHDSDGRTSHQVLFDGQVDVEVIIDLARSLGVAAIIEVKTPESLAESVRRLDERGVR